MCSDLSVLKYFPLVIKGGNVKTLANVSWGKKIHFSTEVSELRNPKCKDSSCLCLQVGLATREPCPAVPELHTAWPELEVARPGRAGPHGDLQGGK